MHYGVVKTVNGFTGVKLNVSSDESTHILLLYSEADKIHRPHRRLMRVTCVIFSLAIQMRETHSLNPNNLFAFQLTPLLIQRKIGLSFWDSEGVLGLSFWVSEGVLGLSFWESEGVLGLSFLRFGRGLRSWFLRFRGVLGLSFWDTRSYFG